MARRGVMPSAAGCRAAVPPQSVSNALIDGWSSSRCRCGDDWLPGCVRGANPVPFANQPAPCPYVFRTISLQSICYFRVSLTAALALSQLSIKNPSSGRCIGRACIIFLTHSVIWSFLASARTAPTAVQWFPGLRTSYKARRLSPRRQSAPQTRKRNGSQGVYAGLFCIQATGGMAGEHGSLLAQRGLMAGEPRALT